MRPSESEQAKSPEGGLKSNKNITSAVTFNLKTENDHRGGEQQHHKSPDVSRPELRNTWRRAQMPYNKLPQVFSQQKQKKKYGGKVKQDTIQNLGKLVENSQYKQTQKYLEPLKPKQEKKQKGQRNLFKPIQKMRDMVSKAQEQIKMIQNITTVKSGPKLSQCIKLQIIKIGHNTGIIKKMLHVPTLTLACVRQEPSTQKESRNLIRDWTNLWRERVSGQERPFVNIYQVLYNYPEGAISVFMSLLNLLDLTATLPQTVIRQVFVQLLKILELFYNLTEMHFGGLSPSQIMFTQDNKIKLSLGLFYHIPIPESFSIYHIKATQKSSLIDFGTTKAKLTKTTIQKSNNLDNERSIDIFKLGLIALNCAIGKFQNFEQSAIIFDAIRYAFTQHGQKKAELQNACCILHSQNYLIQLMTSSGINFQQKHSKKSLQKFISYLKLLKDRYSIHFINFLCQCLKINHTKRANLTQLMNHSFIVTPHDNQNKTVKIQLANLLALSRNWNETAFESATMQKFDTFIGYFRPILQKAGKDVLADLLNLHKERMYQIGKEVGINGQKLGKRIQQLVTQILKQ